MRFRSLRSLGQFALIAATVGLGSTSLYGQSTDKAPSKTTAPAEAPISRIDIFTGYSYLAPHGTVTSPSDGIPFNLVAIDYGAIGSGAYYVNKYVGGQFEFGAHPDSSSAGSPSDHFYTMQIGPIVRYPTDEGITPFIHALGGVVRGGGPEHQPWTWGPALTVGGGVDYNLPFWNHHLALRLFQADYEWWHINFGPSNFGGRENAKVARLSTGIVWKFGSIIPPPPVTYACSVNPPSVFPGDPVTVTGTATNLNPKKTATYTWSGQGVSVKGDNTSGTIDTASLQPGNYTVTGHVSEGQKPGQFADCTASFTVKQFEPPTVSCSANPTTLKPGDSSTITAQGVSPQNRPLTYSYTASAGQVSGSGNTATLTTTGAPAGAITVTCNVADDKGQTASATTTVNIEVPPPPPTPKSQTLCSITFGRDEKRPARVDNEAKACLDDVALNAQRQPDAKVVVVGESAPDEQTPPKHGRKHAAVPANLAAARAVNTKDYLATEKGIDPSRISVRTGSQGNKEVENYLVPAGATFDNDVPGTTPVDESVVKPQARKALPPKHHHKKK
jgi:outer membrane protein OmpA-like peptidoglycan-associated protein